MCVCIVYTDSTYYYYMLNKAKYDHILYNTTDIFGWIFNTHSNLYIYSYVTIELCNII